MRATFVRALVRDYHPSDRAEVLALQTRADRDLDANIPEGFYDDLDRVDVTYAGGAFLVAEDAGHIVGMGGLLPTGEVVRMRVDAGFRRRGIARRLLEELLDRGLALGFDRVFLHTLTQQHAAQRLYLRAGFHESGRGEIHANAVIAYEKTLKNTVGIE